MKKNQKITKDEIVKDIKPKIKTKIEAEKIQPKTDKPIVHQEPVYTSPVDGHVVQVDRHGNPKKKVHARGRFSQ